MSIRFSLSFSLTLVALSLSSFHGHAQKSPLALNGIWADSNSAAFTNAYAIFSADEQGRLVMTHYLEFNGTPMVEKGIGFYSKGTLSYDAVVTKGIPGWATKGQHTLTLSEDGNTLRGYYKDEKGNSGPLVFKRFRP